MKASSAVYAGSLLSLLPGHIPFSAIFKQDYPLQEPLQPSLFISLLQPHQIPPHSARLFLTHLWDYNKKISFLCCSPRSPVRGSENYTCSLRQEAFQHFFSLSSLTCENKAAFSKTANCESLAWASGQITGDERSGAHSGVPPFALTVTLTFPPERRSINDTGAVREGGCVRKGNIASHTCYVMRYCDSFSRLILCQTSMWYWSKNYWLSNKYTDLLTIHPSSRIKLRTKSWCCLCFVLFKGLNQSKPTAAVLGCQTFTLQLQRLHK